MARRPTRASRGRGITIGDAALDLLIERGEGHARAIMLLAQQAYVSARLTGTDAITPPVAEGAYRQALRADRPRHQAWVERVQRLGTPAVNRLTLRSLVAIAKNEPSYARAEATQVKRALDALRNAGFIEKRQGRQGHHVVDPLFAAYLRNLDVGHTSG